MKASHDSMRQGLLALGVETTVVKAGFFIYADFSKVNKNTVLEIKKTVNCFPVPEREN
jgi:hypothetical protein